MEIGVLKGERREPGNRNANQRLRKRGFIPGIVYGHGETPEMVSVSLHDLELSLLHKSHVVKLKVDGKEEQYLLKDVQYDHLQKTPLHVDLMRVSADERVHVKVPIELKGTPKGTADGGGVLLQVVSDIDIECLLLQIPGSIRANVSQLELGDNLKVSDLELPPGVKVLTPAGDIIAVLRAPQAAEPTAAAPVEGEEGAAKEPEVIGRVAKEKPEEEAGG